jgi:hypothetical protein
MVVTTVTTAYALGIFADTVIEGHRGRYARMRGMKRRIVRFLESDDLLVAIGTCKPMTAAERLL